MNLWQERTIEERIAILQSTASDNNMEELAVEKDWWVTIVLKAMFSTSFAPYLLFKGGTSLSKGWKNICLRRFSEDIDIALSRKWFTQDEVKDSYQFADCETNNQIKSLRKASREVVFQQLSSELNQQLTTMGIQNFTTVNVTTEETSQGTVDIATDRDPVVINIEYQSILEDVNEYISPKVKVEISCLSMDEPFEVRPINTLINDKFAKVDDGSCCEVPTILPMRTFLEKAFLLNEEYQKKVPRTERMSRHLYDLEKLMDLYTEMALSDQTLYDEIIAHRKKYYHIGAVNYDSDSKGQIKIWPIDSLESAYEKDYKAMTESFIYDKSPLSFTELKQRILQLEQSFRGK